MYLLQINPTLIAAAVVPALILLIYVYRLDRLEKEPKGLLWRLLLFGVLATAVAGYLERIGIRFLEAWADRPVLHTLLLTFLIVGPAEEGSKYLLLKRRTWYNPNFNCRFDGVVYAVFVSMGFAIWENIAYVAALGFEGAMLRAVTAVPGHASFAVFMGAWYGEARACLVRGDEAGSRRCRRLALLVPLLLHGLYDFIAIRGGEATLLAFVLFILIMFVTAFVTLRRLSRRDRYL
jgi:RsiW-degrading membrane proteinase PrsW (M82 family)